MAGTAPPDPHPSAPATKSDLVEHEAHEKAATWLAGAITSGVGALVTILGLVVILSGGTWFVLDRAEAAGARPVAGVVQRVVLLEQGQLLQRSDTHEVQVDIRELYRVVRDGRSSPRLERPPPEPRDAGP